MAKSWNSQRRDNLLCNECIDSTWGEITTVIYDHHAQIHRPRIVESI
jgi:hypothetical protein